MSTCCKQFWHLLDMGMVEVEPTKYQDNRPVVTFRTHGWLVRADKKPMNLYSGLIDYCPFCGYKYEK